MKATQLFDTSSPIWKHNESNPTKALLITFSSHDEESTSQVKVEKRVPKVTPPTGKPITVKVKDVAPSPTPLVIKRKLLPSPIIVTVQKPESSISQPTRSQPTAAAAAAAPSGYD